MFVLACLVLNVTNVLFSLINFSSLQYRQVRGEIWVISWTPNLNFTSHLHSRHSLKVREHVHSALLSSSTAGLYGVNNGNCSSLLIVISRLPVSSTVAQTGETKYWLFAFSAAMSGRWSVSAHLAATCNLTTRCHKIPHTWPLTDDE